MKTICLILTLFAIPAVAQEYKDTIFVNSTNTVYLVFPSSVRLVDVGKPDFYPVKAEDNTVLIRSTSDNVEFSTLLVQYEDKSFHAILKAKKKPSIFFYDFKDGIKPTNPLIEKKDSATVQPGLLTADQKKNLREKMDAVQTLPAEHKTLGVVSDYLDAAVFAIRNDENNTYIKIVVRNETSLPYKLDFISFQYFQDYKKGFLNQHKKSPKDVFPILGPEIKEVPPNETKALVYTIPSFALANDGYLLVSFREKAGDRILKIKIKGFTIQKSPAIK